MKKKVLLGLLMVSVFSINLSNVSFAGPFDFMGGKKEEPKKVESKKIDLNALSASGVKLILSAGRATFEFADASVIMLEALGKKEESEKLKSLVEEAKKKPNDEQNVKAFMGSTETNKAFEELGKASINSKTKFALSTEQLVNAFSKIGGGLILDAKAVADAKGIVNEATSLVDIVKSDPMKYGISAAMTVISSGKFIADTVPQQTKHLKNFSDKLVAYFKANKIPMPSAEKLKQLSEDMQKG
jgi:hypothetical protein